MVRAEKGKKGKKKRKKEGKRGRRGAKGQKMRPSSKGDRRPCWALIIISVSRKPKFISTSFQTT